MGYDVPVVILAAGSSSRLGQPKALANWKGETLFERSIRLLKESGLSHILTVTHKELAFELIIRCDDTSVIINPDPSAGRTGSLQVGLQSLIKESGVLPERVLVVPIDRCGWEVATIRKILEQNCTCVPHPSGHPLLLYEIDIILKAEPDTPLRELLKVQRIQAPGVYLNIDTRDDVEVLNV